MIVYYYPEQFIPILSIYKACQTGNLENSVYSPLVEMTLLFFKNHTNQSDGIFFTKELLSIIEEFDSDNPFKTFEKIDQLSPSYNLVGHENIEDERIEYLLSFIVRFELYVKKNKNIELSESVNENIILYIEENYQVRDHLKEFLMTVKEYKNSKISLQTACQKLRKFSYK